MEQTPQSNPPMDPKSGFNRLTKTFHNLKPSPHLPPEDAPLSVADFAFSLQANSSSPDSVALIDSSTGHRITYSEFVLFTKSLASYLQNVIKLSKNDVAFILCSKSIKIPILYFALLQLGVIISPGNPLSTESEISHQMDLSKPVIAFATSDTVHKLPKLKHDPVLIDSSEFDSLMAKTISMSTLDLRRVTVKQTDLAGIMYSSGTTGKVKGVMITHRNLTAVIAGIYSGTPERKSQAVLINSVPFFHTYGMFYCFKSVALNEAVVVMERFDLKKMLRAVEEFRVTHLAVAPPVVVLMVKSGLVDGYDLKSLKEVICGGAPLGKDVIEAFRPKFPTVDLQQGYGLTESTGAACRSTGSEESLHIGSVGRLNGGVEARIVDPDTGDFLLPCEQGEIWIRGPNIMKGYVGDPEATSATLVSGGWLRTGDLGYIDKEGFVFIIDRLKELIKYKGYQVAPAELEQLLQSHPEIADAAVIPYPDEESGQVPMAFVVKKSLSNLNERDVINFVAGQVAPYKKIKRVAFVSSIPKTPAGKILRKDLRKMILLGFKSKM